VGLVLARGKTLVSRKYFSLNSTFFWSRGFKPPRPVPVTRVSCFTKQFEDWGSLSGSFRSFTRGFHGEARIRAETIFLRWFRRRITQSGRSVRRGLLIGALKPSLQRSGLWRRECWYFESVPAEVDLLPVSPSRLKWSSIPPGWKRVDDKSARATGKVDFVAEGSTFSKVAFRNSDSVEELQKTFWSDLVSRTWQEPSTRGKLLSDYQSEVVSSGREEQWKDWKKGRFRYRLPFVGVRVRRLTSLQKSFHSLCRVQSHAADKWGPKDRCQFVWLPVQPDPVEEEFACSASDLFEYSRNKFAYSYDEFSYDHRFGLGYR